MHRTKLTPRAEAFMKRHIKKHMSYGYSQKRAVAAAYSEARRKGLIKRKRKAKTRHYMQDVVYTSQGFPKTVWKHKYL